MMEGDVKPLWTLDSAVALVRELHSKLVEKGCTIALGGGCLHKGFSYKDVDIIIHPLECKHESVMNFKFEPIQECLYELGLTYKRNAHIAEYSERNVQIWEYQGKRVDIFFMLA